MNVHLDNTSKNIEKQLCKKAETNIPYRTNQENSKFYFYIIVSLYLDGVNTLSPNDAKTTCT